MKDRLNQVTQYSWCGCGGLASITDPLGHVTSWNRDLEGRVAQKTYFDGTTTYYTYYDSLSGRLKSVTDAKGQSKNYAYNADDTITNVTYTSAVISTPSVSFTYDPNYQRIISMADGSGQTTYSYNPITGSPSPGAGRLATEIGTFAGYTNTFAYDELGRMTNRAINGVSEGMAFDALGRVTRHNNALGVFTPVYLTPGSVASYRVGKFIYPNGQTNVYTYDNAAGDQRLLEILNQGPSGNISKFDYQYDVLSRITQWTQQTNAATAQVMELEYDPEGQLLNAAIAPPGQPAAKAYTYGYDAAGNRTSEQVDVAGSGAVSTATMSAYNEVNQLTNRTGAGALPVRFIKGSVLLDTM